MIDTHSHLYSEEFRDDLDDVVERARQAGVSHVIMPGIDSSCHQDMIETADRLGSWASVAVGLHPTSVDLRWKDELQFVFDHLGDLDFCAIGEIGLDYYWSREFEEQQKEVFEAQLALAADKDLPVIIHSREATEDIFNCIKRVNKPLRGVFHAFAGSVETWQRIRRAGDFKVGIGGVITFKNAHIAESLKEIPLEEILLETDSPYLTPVPFRGRRNESAYVRYTAEKIASVKGVSTEEVDHATSRSAAALFGLFC